MQLLLVVICARAWDGQLSRHRFIIVVIFALFQCVLCRIDTDQLGAVSVSAWPWDDPIWIHRPRIVNSLVEVLSASTEDK